jgi:hypothetical protein
MLPGLTDDNRAFWTGGASGQLLISRCIDCRRWTLPPVGACPGCGGKATPEPVSGRGVVFSYTINTHQYHPDVPPPNLIALVQLDEQDDLRVATNLVNCDVDEVTVGLPVQVLFEQQGEVYYPLFEPARGAA